jgi:hypothetical protein
MERDSKRIASEWNREIEAEIRRLDARQEDGWGRVVVLTLLEVIWLVAVFAVLGLFSRGCTEIEIGVSRRLPPVLGRR